MLLTKQILTKLIAYALSDNPDLVLLQDLYPLLNLKIQNKEAIDGIKLLKFIVQKRIDGIPIESILLSINQLYKSKIVEEILQNALQIEVDETITDIIKTFIKTLKLQEAISKIEDAIYDIRINILDVDIAYKKLKEICESILVNIALTETIDLSQLLMNLDLQPENIESIFEKIKLMEDSFFYSVATGFKELDRYLQGYQPGRVYIVAAPPGRGKSMFLLNEVYYAAKYFKKEVKHKFQQRYGDEIKPYILYITNENTTIESLARFLGIIKQSTVLIEDLNSEENKNTLKNFLQETECRIEFRYVAPHQTTVVDIINIIENTFASKKQLPFFIVIDYLDRLKTTSVKNRELRIELGRIVDELKHLSIRYNLPILTATQLNRESLKEDKTPDLTHISESWKKVENADCVMLLKNKQQENKLELYIAKLRYAKMPEFPIELSIKDGYLLVDKLTDSPQIPISETTYNPILLDEDLLDNLNSF